MQRMKDGAVTQKGEPMRLVDADALEREGWSLHRSYQQDKNTMVYETKSIVEIPTAQPEQRWIPCSERLPELSVHRSEPFLGEWDNSESVLVYCNDDRFEAHYLIGQYTNGFGADEVENIEGWIEAESCEEIENVIAWMPLPEPYKEGE